MRPRLVSALLAAAAAALIPSAAFAQQADIHRTDLLRAPLSPGTRVAVQVLVEFQPGAVALRHAHPGEELVYVVEGVLEYRLDGSPPVTLKAGDVLFIPNGTIHAVTNVNAGRSAELATYVVDPMRPLAEYPIPQAEPQKDKKP